MAFVETLRRVFLGTPEHMEQQSASDPTIDIYRLLWKRSLENTTLMRGEWKDERVRAAFERFPRNLFVDSASRFTAVQDPYSLDIGHGQTISCAWVVKKMTELVDPKPGNRALDVGTGSGFQAAILSDLVGPDGSVTTVERHKPLYEQAEARLRDLGITNTRHLLGNALDPEMLEGKFDVIVSAAGSRGVPDLWLRHLAEGGRLIHPVDPCDLHFVRKISEDTFEHESMIAGRFVPLIG